MTEMPQKKVAYITGEYPKVSHTFIQREVAELRSLGLDVFTCTIRRPPPDTVVGTEQAQEAENTFGVLENCRMPHRLLLAHMTILLSSPKRWFTALLLAWKTRAPGAKALLYQMFYFVEAGVLAHFLLRRKAEHLHDHFGSSSCTVAMLAAEMADIPFSFTLHGPDIFFEPRKWAVAEKIARAKFTVCISHFCRSQAMLFSDQKHWRKLHIVHCGVDIDQYDHAPKQHITKTAIFVGRLAAVKGVTFLLDAFLDVLRTHPDALLTLVGNGPERAALERQVQNMGIANAVNFVGYMDQAGVAEHLSKSDLLVLPSFAEGVPVVLMEALASRIPVIATQVAGVSELVKHGKNGFIVPPANSAALSDRLSELFSAPELCKSMGMEGRKTVMEEFDIAGQAQTLFCLLTDGINRS